MEGCQQCPVITASGLTTLPSDGPHCLTGGETEAQRGGELTQGHKTGTRGSGFQPGSDPGLNLVPHQTRAWGILAGAPLPGSQRSDTLPCGPGQCLGILRAFPHQCGLSKTCRALSLQSSEGVPGLGRPQGCRLWVCCCQNRSPLPGGLSSSHAQRLPSRPWGEPSVISREDPRGHGRASQPNLSPLPTASKKLS